MATSATISSSSNPAQSSLWDEAIQLLRPEAVEAIRLKKDDKLHVLAEVLAAANEKKAQMRDKQWKYTRSNGKTVVFREIFDKIALRLNKLKDIGDTLTQVDPLHAGMPWAVIKFFLQAAVADTEKLGIVFDGIEMVVGMISKYTIFEQLYLKDQTQTTQLLRTALVRIYASILSFLAEAKHYYAERTGLRVVKSTLHIGLSKMTTLKQDVQDEQFAVNEIARLIDAESLRALNGDTKHMSSELSSLRKALDQLESPIQNANDHLEGIVKHIERMQLFELLGWISNMPYIQHHETVRSGRLENSGIWIFNKPEYMDWRKSQSSSLLWLHGMPGSGKSKLVSFLVDTFKTNELNKQTEALAYVYCTQSTSEPQRAEPDSILRSLARQLSGANKDMSIREPTLRKYQQLKEHGFDLRRLTLDEVKTLILELVINTPTTIVIDALDECNPRRRFELISMFEQLLQAQRCLVKIIVSSRDSRVPNRLEALSTFSVDASQTAQDIDRFVDLEVKRAIHEERLLRGNVSAHLEGKIISTLKKGAQGMFLWVSLQIQSLCDPEKFKLEADVLEELGRLPAELHDVYGQICNKVMGEHTGRFARKVAITALRWLLCAQRALSTDDFIAAVYFSSTGGKEESLISRTTFMEICGSLLIADNELDVFRFFHSSVREFLQTRPDFAPTLNHLTAAEICINTLLTRESLSSEKVWQNKALSEYVTLFWALHIEHSDRGGIQSGNTGLILTQLSTIGSAPKWFMRWLLQIESASVALDWNDPLKKKIENALCDAPATAFFMSCAFGFINIVDALTRNDTSILHRQNARKATGLHIACQFGYTDIVELLLARGSMVDEKDAIGRSPLFLASIEGFDAIVTILSQHGADPTIENSEYGTALQAASLRGHERTVLSLVNKVNIDSEDGQFGTALQAASLRGHASIVRILLNEGADVNAPGGDYKITPQLTSTDTKEITGMARAFKFFLDKTEYNWEATAFRSKNRKFEAFVQLLLDRHVDISIEKEGFGTALHAACRGGYAIVVQILLGAGADPNIEGGVYGTAMQAAAVTGKPEVITALLEHGADVNYEAGIYNTALQAACRFNHPECFNILVENGADINAQGGVYGNALQAAVRAGNLPFVKRLISQGSYVDACGGKYGTALQAACCDGSLEIVQCLLDFNADMNMEGGQFGTALQSACANGHLDVVELLVSKGANFGRALQLASLGGHEQTARFLLEKGCDPNYHEGAFGTPLQMATVAGREIIVHLLLEHEAGLDCNSAKFGSPLQVAAATGNHNLVRLLLDKGANPSISGYGAGMEATQVFSQSRTKTFGISEEVSVLEAAAESGHEGIVRTILRWYTMNAKDNDLRKGEECIAFKALCKASELGHTAVVQLLLESHAPVSSKNRLCPLVSAARKGHERTIRILLDHPGQRHYDMEHSLLAAIKGHHHNIVNILLETDQAIHMGSLYLSSATYQGNFKLAQKFFKAGMNDAVIKKAQCQAMLLACFQGHVETVKLLLENNADVNLPSKKSLGYEVASSLAYPLHSAAFRGHDDIVELLISRGASVNTRGGDYETALIAASFSGHPKIVEILIRNGADLNIVTEDRGKMGNALQAAARNGHVRVVEVLLQSPADINAEGGMYGTAIQAAAAFGHEEVVGLLVQWGADLRSQGGKPETVSENGTSIEKFEKTERRGIRFLSSILPKVHSSGRRQNGKFGTALQAAAVNGNARIVRILLEHGADAGDIDMHGQTPLHRAAYYGHEEVVSVLLEYGTAIETKDVRGLTALSWAAFWGYEKLLQPLSHNFVSINDQDGWGKSALHEAASNGQLKVLQALLQGGANLECADKRGCTPLFSALTGGHLSLTCFLLDQGACVTRQNLRGLTVLHEAAFSGYSSMIRPILAAGLGVDPRCSAPKFICHLKGIPLEQHYSSQSTPLHLAAIRGFYKPCLLLILHRADLEARDACLKSPLHLAAKGGFSTVVNLLLKRGANVDARDSAQMTPLHLAAQRGRSTVVTLLLNWGATINTDSHDGLPLHLAAKQGHDDVVAILLKWGANLEASDPSGKTPLCLAMQKRHHTVVAMLLEWGAGLGAHSIKE